MDAKPGTFALLVEKMNSDSFASLGFVLHSMKGPFRSI